MMKKMMLLVMVCVLGFVNIASADTFGSGANQFTIDFVNISGSSNPTSGYGIVSNDYRMGTFEITNDQFGNFAANNPSYTGADVPSNNVSWFEAAQFVNFLNTSTGNQAAYKFSSGVMSAWGVLDIGYDASNPFRNSNAIYVLPTEDEWVKAAYWNGTTLQAFATKSTGSLTQGNGASGVGWNYYDNAYATNPSGPWDVGSGSEELNGTFDMMGNVMELLESPYSTGDYSPTSNRGLRGGGFGNFANDLNSSTRFGYYPDNEHVTIGFRVASVPEPCSLVLLGLGGLVLRRRRRA